MILALSDPYPIIVGLCLLLAVYMFAALKFPAMRFMFQMKRGAAGLMRMDQDANRRMGETLGLVLCPIFGVGALLAAAWFGLEWKASRDSKVRRAELAVETQQRRVNEMEVVLREWELVDVYFAAPVRMGVSEEGRAEVEAFLASFTEELGPACVALHAETVRARRGVLTAVYQSPDEDGQDEDEEKGLAMISMDLNGGELSARINTRGARLPATGFKLLLPDGVMSQWSGLRDLERIDLEARRREEQRMIAEESARLALYKEKTFEGPSAWQVYEQVHAAEGEEREERERGFLGVKIDWEVQLGVLDEEDGSLSVRASQSPPQPGPYWSVFFDIDRAVLPDLDRVPRHQFARIKGTIESLEAGGIRVEVETLERFDP